MVKFMTISYLPFIEYNTPFCFNTELRNLHVFISVMDSYNQNLTDNPALIIPLNPNPSSRKPPIDFPTLMPIAFT